MSGFNLFDLTIDESVSKKGVWVDFFAGSRLKIASSSSHVYKAMITRLYKQNKLRLDDSNDMNLQLIQDITCEVMSKTVLLDWENINWPDASGTVVENIPYTPELGKAALLRADQLREFVSEQAARPALFHKAVEEEAVKN